MVGPFSGGVLWWGRSLVGPVMRPCLCLPVLSLATQPLLGTQRFEGARARTPLNSCFSIINTRLQPLASPLGATRRKGKLCVRSACLKNGLCLAFKTERNSGCAGTESQPSAVTKFNDVFKQGVNGLECGCCVCKSNDVLKQGVSGLECDCCV